jgi:hypothetical protein
MFSSRNSAAKTRALAAARHRTLPEPGQQPHQPRRCRGQYHDQSRRAVAEPPPDGCADAAGQAAGDDQQAQSAEIAAAGALQQQHVEGRRQRDAEQRDAHQHEASEQRVRAQQRDAFDGASSALPPPSVAPGCSRMRLKISAASANNSAAPPSRATNTGSPVWSPVASCRYSPSASVSAPAMPAESPIRLPRLAFETVLPSTSLAETEQSPRVRLNSTKSATIAQPAAAPDRVSRRQRHDRQRRRRQQRAPDPDTLAQRQPADIGRDRQLRQQDTGLADRHQQAHQKAGDPSAPSSQGKISFALHSSSATLVSRFAPR